MDVDSIDYDYVIGDDDGCHSCPECGRDCACFVLTVCSHCPIPPDNDKD